MLRMGLYEAVVDSYVAKLLPIHRVFLEWACYSYIGTQDEFDVFNKNHKDLWFERRPAFDYAKYKLVLSMSMPDKYRRQDDWLDDCWREIALMPEDKRDLL